MQASPAGGRQADIGLPVGKPGLAGVFLRIERAERHLADFDRQVQEIAAACRKAVTIEKDEQRSELVFRLDPVPVLSDELSLIIGDAIHNARVALDYLAWQLVLVAGGTPGKETSFPVLDRQKKSVIKPAIPVGAEKLLDQVQPYHQSQPWNHELAVLHELDIADKHHELLVAILATDMMGWRGDAEPAMVNSGSYDRYPEVCRFKCAGAPPGFRPTLNFTVRSNQPEAGAWGKCLGASRLIRRSLEYVEREVIPRFQPFF